MSIGKQGVLNSIIFAAEVGEKGHSKTERKAIEEEKRRGFSFKWCRC